MRPPYLYHFSPGEFTRAGAEWFSAMSPRLLVMLDLLRFRWGRPIHISKHPRAVGRHDGESDSQHNFDKWGEVRAVDVQPANIHNRDDAYRFYLMAVELGFTGIGFYPQWALTPGFHLDVREPRRPGYPATWGVIAREGRTIQVSVNDALEALL